MSEKTERNLLFAVVCLTGMSGIILEIGLTRIFSISLWHHFAFLSISVALFGIGVSGVFLTVFPGVLEKNYYKTLFYFTWLTSILSITAFFIFTRINLDVRNLGNLLNLGKFIIFYLFLAMPFFFAGCVMSSVIRKKSEIVQKLYFFDMTGAGMGCLFVFFLIGVVGGQGIVVLSSILSGLAGLVIALVAKDGIPKNFKLFSGVALLIIITLFVFAGKVFHIPLPPDKALNYYTKVKGAKIIYSHWNSFSRVDAFEPVPRYTWGLSRNFKGEMPPQIGITIDGDGFTSIVKFDGDIEKVDFPLYTLGSMVHGLNRGKDALIIGAGGGIDVLSSYKYGADKIDAVEINPDIVYLATEKYRKYSGNLFEIPGIHMITAEGRNYIKRNNKKYGLVYLPLVDSWAATYSGAYSLSENYLYTTQAFQDYYDHVREGGYVSFSRWEYIPQKPYQTYRLCSLAMSASKKDLRGSVVITSHEKLFNFIWKNGDFTDDEIAFIKDFCRRGGFEVNYLPGMRNDYAILLDPSKTRSFQKSFPLDISAVTDDKPFFYLTDRWRNFFDYLENTIWKKNRFPVVFTIFLVVLVLSIVFSIIFIILPLKLKGVGKFKKSSMLFLIYFSLLGLAFMFVEITLMSKLILFLGHPVYSLSIVLFSLLVFTGIGSYLSSFFHYSGRRIMFYDTLILCITGLIYFLFLDHLLGIALALPSMIRALLTVVLLAPLGMCLGMPFPLGLKLLGERNSTLIPWAWGINGCASVLGSVLSLVFAQAVGFWKTLLIALCLYVVAYSVFSMIYREKIIK